VSTGNDNIEVPVSDACSPTPTGAITSSHPVSPTSPITLLDTSYKANQSLEVPACAEPGPASPSVPVSRTPPSPLSVQPSYPGTSSNSPQDLLTGANSNAALLGPPSPDCSIKRLNLWDVAFNSLDEAEKKRLEVPVVPKGKKKAEAEDKKEE
jgi:hypothetical protein